MMIELGTEHKFESIVDWLEEYISPAHRIDRSTLGNQFFTYVGNGWTICPRKVIGENSVSTTWSITIDDEQMVSFFILKFC